MEIDHVLGIVFPVALAVIVSFLVCLYTRVWIRWIKVRRALERQDIKGPRPSFLMGNLPEMQKIQLQAAMRISNQGSYCGTISHDYTSTLFPYFEHWRKEYGPIYTYSTGMRQHLYMNQFELVKELNQSISLSLGKPSYVTKRLAPMLGNGILRSNGLTWAHQRKIIAPEFYMDKVKGMVEMMSDLAQSLLRKWGDAIEAQGGTAIEIKVDDDLRTVSADVISRTCFGASSHKGQEIFTKLRSLQKIISQQSFLFGVNFGSLSFWQRSQISCLEGEIESMIWNAVKEREKGCSSSNSCSSENDLMRLIMEGASKDQSLSKSSSKRFIVDNCKSIYFAGHESTAVAASWCLMLLALHPEWQTRVRTEVAQVCPDGLPNTNSITQLKVVTMVILEALRLYSPAAFVSREALEETQIGNIVIPKGVCLWTLIPNLHRDPDNWGPDASDFKPERFANGVSKACKSPQAYIPFGVGPRLCLGRNFAMVQLKVLLSLIVSKFSFSLSPNYRHSPSYRMIVEPFLSSQSPIPSIDQLDGYVRREAGHSGRRDMEGSVVRNPISGPPSMELRWVARRRRDAKGPPKLPLLLQPPEVVPLYISTNLQHVNTRALRDLYSSCNLSYYRNPNSAKQNSPVEEVDINKLRLAVSRSAIVVSVFCKSHHIPSDSNEEKSSKEEAGRITELRDISQRVIPISPFNGELVGFGRAVSDQVLTASIYDVMVIPSLQRMGIGRMIVEKIVRMLTNKGVYDISALCTQKERLFFMACGFGNDVLGSTTMMYARFRPTP